VEVEIDHAITMSRQFERRNAGSSGEVKNPRYISFGLILEELFDEIYLPLNFLCPSTIDGIIILRQDRVELVHRTQKMNVSSGLKFYFQLSEGLNKFIVLLRLSNREANELR